MAKDKSELIKELMHKPDQIRNIGIVAHIDHGKCISGDSRLILTNGEVQTAGSLFTLAQKEGKKVVNTTEKTVFDISHLGIEVFSLDQCSGNIEKQNVSHAWKLNGGDLIKIKLRNGFEVKTTPEHKYVVLNNLEFAEKEAKDLKLGDRVVCTKKLNISSNMDMKKEMLTKLSKENFYVRLSPEFGERLKKTILEFGLEKVAEKISNIKMKSFYHGTWQYRYLLSDLIVVADLFKLPLNYIYDQIESIVYRKGKWRGKNSLPNKLPQNFTDFFYLAGLFFGDGSTNKFVVGKKELGERFIEICKALDITLTFRNYEGETPEIGTNNTVRMMLHCLFDYPLKRKSHNISVSQFLNKAPDDCCAAFISGYFDCDGTVEKARRAISLVSVSSQMLSDLSLLLLRFGCISSVQGDTLYISGSPAKHFVEKIGFRLQEKQDKAIALAKNTIGSHVIDAIPVGDRTVLSEVKKIRLQQQILNPAIFNEDLAFVEVKAIESVTEDDVYDFTVPDYHNFLAEGMIIHNTTLSDNLVAGAGMISEELAGKQLFTDFDKQEQERGITIYAANVSMVHEFEGKDHLINLIDTPGHVDFGGDVTRAMRAVDGVVAVVDAVEGAMPQTETVIRQALKENVRPVLFINKADRLIKELELTPEQMQERFKNIIAEVNALIQKYAHPDVRDNWLVTVNDGSVAFGSAVKNWAISVPLMQKSGVSFKDVIDLTRSGQEKELARKSPLHRVVLDMVIHHLPNPVEAQKYRIPTIWPGDRESDIGKDMMRCNPEGKLAAIVTKISPDPHAGYVATVRIFSGKLVKGQEVYLVTKMKREKTQQVAVYKGPQRIAMDEVVAGNICGVVGLREAFSGETLCDPDAPMEGFEAIKHLFEPVVTKSVEPKKPKDLARLIEFLKKASREDPTLQVKIDEQTGEYLVSGMGELHINAKVENKLKEEGIEVDISPPIVIYHEGIRSRTPDAIEGKSPNKHNKLYIVAEPLTPAVYEAMVAGAMPGDLEIKRKDVDLQNKLVELGFDREESKRVKLIHNRNILLDTTAGVHAILEIMEMVKQAFKEAMNEGPLAREPCAAVIVKLVDAKLHEDAIHRGPAQIIPAVRGAIRQAMIGGKAFIMEPKQVIRIDVPTEQLSGAMKEVQNRRGQVLDMKEERGTTVLKSKVPVAEMFGFNSALKSATGGHGFFWMIDIAYEPLPKELEQKVVSQIKQRKGIAGSGEEEAE